MIARNIENRILKLEAFLPEPPHPLDGLTCDELTVLVLEDCALVIADKAASDDDHAKAKAEFERHTGDIIETVNWRAGRWVKPPGFPNYEESLDFPRKRWIERMGGKIEDYVPTLTAHEGEGLHLPDGPAIKDVMTRRAAAWAHPIVKQIVSDAPRAVLPDRSLFKECKSFAAGKGLAASPDCGWACRHSCLRARRGSR